MMVVYSKEPAVERGRGLEAMPARPFRPDINKQHVARASLPGTFNDRFQISPVSLIYPHPLHSTPIHLLP